MACRRSLHAPRAGGTIERPLPRIAIAAKGLWTAPDGHTEQDDVVMVEVVTDTFDRDGGERMRSRWPSVLDRKPFMCGRCPWTC